MNKLKQKFTSYVKGQGFAATVLIAILIATVVFVNIIVYTISTVVPLYIHWDEKDDFTISDSNDVLFKEYIDSGKEVTVTFCSYEDVVSSHDTGKYVLETAKKFAEKYPSLIKLRFVNAVTKLDSDGKSVADELEMYRNDGENIINETSVVFSSDSRFKVLTDLFTSASYGDFYTLNESKQMISYNGEEILAASVLWTLRESRGVAYITVGHGETANYSLYTILTSAGYDIKDINLRKSDVPEDASILVISSPTADFERGAENTSLITEYDRLRAYQKRGGNFLVFLNPMVKKLPVLEGFVSEFGISYLKSESGENALIKDSSNAITTDGFTLVAEYSDFGDGMRERIEERTGDIDASVILRNVGVFNLDESKGANSVLISSSTSRCEAEGAALDANGNYTIAACSVSRNDMAESAKMFVMSEGMITSGDAIVSKGYSNKDFIYSIFDEFFEQGDMPYGCNSIIFDTQILENLTMGTAKIYTAAIFALPVLVAVCGAVMLRRRKNR